ncbi:hypothetical protein P154DRAFT_571805 [Amniculicola lignicola CBS 123094]|uniref:Uncharacterized protein n=1 Tax=Amniculicola lignicola CBS 123094 TaxID=1392246 RepID=A0A6A5WV35_9PLEO|nr:hypothetical protein P154DRAFT_571805 [Amniculicola lignicola CBS 123094]
MQKSRDDDEVEAGWGDLQVSGGELRGTPPPAFKETLGLFAAPRAVGVAWPDAGTADVARHHFARRCSDRRRALFVTGHSLRPSKQTACWPPRDGRQQQRAARVFCAHRIASACLALPCPALPCLAGTVHAAVRRPRESGVIGHVNGPSLGSCTCDPAFTRLVAGIRHLQQTRRDAWASRPPCLCKVYRWLGGLQTAGSMENALHLLCALQREAQDDCVFSDESHDLGDPIQIAIHRIRSQGAGAMKH